MKPKIIKSLSYASNYYTLTFEEFIDSALLKKVDGVQFIPDQHPNLYSEFNQSRVKELKRKLHYSGLVPTMHNVFYDINLCSLVPDVSEFSRKITEQVIVLSKKISAETITVHPGYIYPGWKNDPKQHEAFWFECRNNINKLVNLSKKHDINVLIENGSYFLTSKKSDTRNEFHLGINIPQLSKLIELSDHELKVCMDVGKLRASDIDPYEFMDIFCDDILEVQVSTKKDLEFIDYLLSVSNQSKINLVFEGRSNLDFDFFMSKNFN